MCGRCRFLTVVLVGGWGLSGIPGPASKVAADPAPPTPGHSVPRPRRSHAAPAPEILLTGATRQTRAIEARLAAFVGAVRRREGARAVRFLSRATAPPVRAAVVERDWPWRTASQAEAPLFASPRLRLRTVGLRGGRARVRIGPPRVNPGSREASGFYDIGMVREDSRWQVRLPRSAAPRAGVGSER